MMKSLIFFLTISFCIASCSVKNIGDSTFNVKDSIFTKGGYTLHFINNSSAFADSTKRKFISTFFEVYPKLVNDFNLKASKVVYFKVDTSFVQYPAAASGGRISYSADWFKKHPEDTDVVTHEIMHVIQNYGNTNGPWWITEGIADYVRHKYGLNNKAGGWSLTPFNANQKYDNGYRITARFFLWLENKVKPGIVKTLDEKMRAHAYNDNLWKELTGKSVAELWQQYSLNPAI